MNLFPALADSALTSMNLLNEIAERHPAAISFAAGRPTEEYFDHSDIAKYLDSYRTYLLHDRGYTDAQVNRELMQYGRTTGVINDLVARNLLVDEGITASPESIVVTVGCQEAMFLVLRALRASPSDVVLAVAPTYVGLTGAARLVDMPVLPVRSGPAGIDLEDLLAQVCGARAEGLRPRALYLVPEFANPSGVSLDVETRRRLLELAESEDFLLLEDNPYGLFQRGFGTRPPTLKALDASARVVYLGSFAKTAVPGARVGYVVADQPVGSGLLATELGKIKSMLTVNTSPIAQAVVGGKLLEHGCSLVSANVREAAIYRRNMNLVLRGLSERFPSLTWTAPSGGFFVVLSVDFRVDDALLEHSAAHHGVLWTPMYHFYGGNGGHGQLRLSCSAVSADQIPEGLDRLAALVSEVRRAA